MSLALEPISLDLALPWHRSPEQERKFKFTLTLFLGLMLALLVALTLSEIVEPEKEEEEKIEFKTKVLIKPVTITPPKVEKPKPKPKPKKVEPKEVKSQARSKKVDKKKADVTSHGLNKVSSQLSALRQSFDLTRNQKKNVSNNNAGNVSKASRSLLGKDNATKKSQGIKLDTNIELDERTTLAAHTSASVEGMDQGGVTGGDPVSRYSSHISSARTMESIRRTFEANKGGIFALYYRDLSNRPELSGKFVFSLKIDPSGSTSGLRLISSELNSSKLESMILEKIRRIRFQKEDVESLTVQYTYHFIPN